MAAIALPRIFNASYSLTRSVKPSDSPSSTLPKTSPFPFQINSSRFHLKLIPNLKSRPLSHLFNVPRSTNPETQHNLNQIKSIFTGIVEEMGEVRHLGITNDGGGYTMRIAGKVVLEGVNLGDSIAVNGTCLTVTEFDESEFTVGLAPETLRKTSLIELKSGSLVNLERAMTPTTRMGGHFVQGHVDGTGEIVSTVTEGDSLWVKVKTKPEILRYIVGKGFIAVDGTSLTVVEVFEEESCFNFMLVAYTQQKIVIPLKKVGQKVNLEVDILGKYVERLLGVGTKSS
ncbi:riboflavin synthase [Impatiens glandulifera]|uniref:riboflavin synthase n=1 Tax=Impatiens glandulifera TaxID=253017 RepID=UPI001FB15ECD|nr:riboflavin synthase [Impatiens glandulifera]XP_047337876.1 riboflavin synthase [Impatiens glandulifera]